MGAAGEPLPYTDWPPLCSARSVILSPLSAVKPSRAVREYLDALDGAEEPDEGRKTPKVISPSDPATAWTAKANKRVQFGYGLNYLIDNEHAIIVDVEPTPARTFDEVRATGVMIKRTQERFGLKPRRPTVTLLILPLNAKGRLSK